MKTRAALLLALVLGSTACKSLGGVAAAAAAHPAAVIGGVALAAYAAQEAFKLDPGRAAQAEQEYPAVEARVMASNPAYPPP